MTIKVVGLDRVTKNLRGLTKQVDFALMQTLNQLAFDSKKALEGELLGGMKVRKNTSKAFAVDKAKKTSLSATIRLKDDWHQYAIPQHYKGGSSMQIAFEEIMIKRGYMTRSNSAIPMKRMGKAMYNNIKNLTRPALSQSKYFVVKTRNKNKHTKHLPPGIYKRLKKKPKLVMLFVPESNYTKRFDMYKTVEKVVNRRAEKYFFENLERAWANRK